ncbi:MAG TPA: aminotransferase class I/II-fold pyridoxal phosphate-dependent enzyme [Spirochaetota bacterium]|nr:aminotransferase class I/II-fold pyridoxal phosphate-dependent enzyme [Spirochaetota bacterium]HOM37872.1 aminotransferase class I/II-fold pyridoxal phosphate-dependent enzyme [Spirochaetota bacterium]HPQ48676.1 aminotransferase class I/II-fold pyridoxal phosphate-dependent enzyme [Spirochaetota bacterium]
MNIEVSSRIKRLPPYIFGEINALKLKLRREGKDIIDLGMGNPDKPAPKEVMAKAIEVIKDPKAHRYSASKGISHLLKEVAKFYNKKYGVELNPDTEVIATIGSKEGLSHLALALLGPGDSALVPTPAFPIHIWSIILAGANVITVSLEKSGENFIDHLFKTYEILWPKPKVLILNFPHNPTTKVVDIEFFRLIIDFALKKEIIVIQDFAYADIVFDGYKAPSILQVHRAKEVAVEFITMSKSFSMAGWRIGFCVGNEEIIKALSKIKGYYDYGIFTPIQVGGIIALRELWDKAPDEYARIYQDRRDTLVEGLNKIGWEIQKPKATMFLWAKIPENFIKAGSLAFSKFLLEEAEVCVSPGISFGEEGEGYLRIALVENEKRIKQAIRQIKKALDKKDYKYVLEKYNK